MALDRRTLDLMSFDTLVVRGAREHNLKNISVELPRDQLIVLTGLSGSGQVEPGLRHHLRRGPAALRRVAVVVRPAVPRPDGQARRRLHRGPVAGHLHRPEVGVAQPPLHRRHHHRGLRLPPPALRPHRRAPLPRARRAAGAPDARSRSSTAWPSCPTAPASRCWRRSCGAARASTRRCSRTCRPRVSSGPGSTARPSGHRRVPQGRRPAGPLRAAHHRGRRRPAGEAATASSAA